MARRVTALSRAAALHNVLSTAALFTCLLRSLSTAQLSLGRGLAHHHSRSTNVLAEFEQGLPKRFLPFLASVTTVAERDAQVSGPLLEQLKILRLEASSFFTVNCMMKLASSIYDSKVRRSSPSGHGLDIAVSGLGAWASSFYKWLHCCWQICTSYNIPGPV
eukprot:4068171-Pleurochrysis_carterae.AAC.3